ncbi:MAG: HsdM family class I SAM-dependent methyltransferase [Coriobacteriales bacterium]
MAYGSTLHLESDTSTTRKLRGAFFTPPELAEALSSWAVRLPNDRVLEPACGEAEFLIAACRRLSDLGASLSDISSNVRGFELHQQSAQAARKRCKDLLFEPEITAGDFLQAKPEPHFDAVIGNPPYVRFQLIDNTQKASIREISYRSGLDISPMASAWAPFVVHASAFLKEGGRLAFVLPAELMTVNYASSIRSFLMDEFSEISLVTFDSQVFPEVQEEVVLLFAGGYHLGPTDRIIWRQCSDEKSLFSVPAQVFYPSSTNNKWSSGLMQASALDSLSRLEESGFCRMGEWGRFFLGSVTGNNRYFALSKKEAQDLGLTQAELLPLSPPGSSHLRNLAFTRKSYSDLEAKGKRTRLFYPGDELSSAATAYIQHGVELGVNNAYKCRKRSPWWRVPLTKIPDAFLTYMNDYAPNLCANEAQCYCLNSVHGIVFKDELRELGMSLLSLACINSATLLSSEIEGRAYGGGILKIEPREARRLLVPSPSLIESCSSNLKKIKEEATSLLVSGNLSAVRDKVDSILFDSMAWANDACLEALQSDKERLYKRRRQRNKKK